MGPKGKGKGGGKGKGKGKGSGKGGGKGGKGKVPKNHNWDDETGQFAPKFDKSRQDEAWAGQVEVEAASDGNLKEFVNKEWHAIRPQKIGESGKAITPEWQEQAQKVYEARLLQHENVLKQDSDQIWMRKVIRSGTQADKISSLVMLTQSCPLFAVNWIRSLLSMASKKGRKESMIAIDALRELFSQNLLPDRKLFFLHQHVVPLELKNALDKELVMVAFWFEDFLKTAYASFIQIVVNVTHDDTPHFKNRMLQICQELLVEKPEQERVLLSCLINKFGDLGKKTSSIVTKLLKSILETHPSMVKIMISEVATFLNRFNLSRRAQTTALTFLSEIKLRRKIDQEVAKSMTSILLSQLESVTVKKEEPEKKKRVKGEKRKKKSKKKVKRGIKWSALSEEDNKMIRAVVAGLIRAFPYLPSDCNIVLEEDMVLQLFKIVHLVPAHSTRILMLRFLFTVFSSYDAVPDRFYRALYEQVANFEIWSAANKLSLINLLVEAMKGDHKSVRVQAVARRVLQVGANSADAPVLVAALVSIREVQKNRKGIVSSLMNVVEDGSDDENEIFTDQKAINSDSDDDEEEQEEDNNDKATSSETKPSDKHAFNPFARDPAYAKADSTQIWEAHALKYHMHPWIRAQALEICNLPLDSTTLEHVKSYKGDPIEDLSLSQFLEKFAYINRKEGEKKFNHLKPTKTSGFLNRPVNAEKFAEKHSVLPQEEFFHAYFNDDYIKEKRAKEKAEKFVVDMSKIDPESMISLNDKDMKTEAQEDLFFDHFLAKGGMKDFGGEDIDMDFDDFSDDGGSSIADVHDL
eukprot:gene1046-525_t